MKKWWKKRMHRLAWMLPGNAQMMVCGTGRITYLRHRSPWQWAVQGVKNMGWTVRRWVS